MKISVCGKGGSGKSTFTALLAGAIEAKGWHVLVVDSDESNSGLFRLLGFSRPPLPLMDLLGGKSGLKERMRQPEVLGEESFTISGIPAAYRQQQDGLTLVSIGKIMQSLEGCACPMGVLSREFLRKLKTREKEAVIVDMEAGVEHLGRGVDTSLDTVLIVVEPSFESLELAQRIRSMTQGIPDDSVGAVLNKVPTPEIGKEMTLELEKRRVPVIGSISHDPEIFRSSLKGGVLLAGKAADEIRDIADRILVPKASAPERGKHVPG